MSQSDTKQRLINSAIKIFSKQGFFNTKVSDIVKDAGVAQGTFYLYFKSKDDIFFYIVQEVVDKIESTIEAFNKKDLPPKEKIKQFAEEIFKLLLNYKDVAEIYFFHLLCTNEKFKEVHFQTEKKIRNFYLDTLKELKDREIITDLILGFAKRLFEIKMLKENRPIDEILKELHSGIEIVFRGIK